MRVTPKLKFMTNKKDSNSFLASLWKKKDKKTEDKRKQELMKTQENAMYKAVYSYD